MKNFKFLFLLLFLGVVATAQDNRLSQRQQNPSEIYHNIKKLGFLGSALFVAAHPDDENTRMISWLANERMAQTAYLSLTRGDGGQNLIGAELREQLGMIRTQELLEARNIDGGQQFFTRANDFGYSKHPDETLEIWNKDEVLSDVVKVIRTFKPDIIINRFNHRTPGTTHGHHTSSAMLSYEAFELAGDKNSFPDQLGEVDTWTPNRLFFNTSWWFYGSRENFEKADKTNLLQIDAGSYYNYRGLSNSEVAALSRSQHQSQGFGSSGARGSQLEYIEFLKGDFPSDKSDPFSGINTTWSRVKGGKAIEKLLRRVLENFNFKNPEASLSSLLKLRNAIQKLDDQYWRSVKLEETEQLIKSILSLYIEASTPSKTVAQGNEVNITIEVTNRSSKELSFSISNVNSPIVQENLTVSSNKSKKKQFSYRIPDSLDATTPYYLINK
ncbi:MAG: PIG-L family deacetylase, partial [Nonlabens sp.]